MALIKVTISELESVQGQVSKLSNKAGSCGNAVARVKSNLDMKVKQKNNIDDLLNKSSRQLKQQSELLHSYANVLNNVVDDFLKADKNVTDDILPIISAVERITKIPNKSDYLQEQLAQKIDDIGSLFNAAVTKTTDFFSDVIDKGKDFLDDAYGNVVKTTKECVSWVKDSYSNKGIVYDTLQYGKAALKVGKGVVKIVGAVGTIFGTAGGSIPLATLAIISAGNDIINGFNDAAYIYTDQYDMVGESNYLKEKVVEGGSQLGEMLGNKEAGEFAGEFIYTGVDVVSFLDGADEMLKSFGKVNTVVTGSTGYSSVWGKTEFDDVLDNEIKFGFDADYFIRKGLNVAPSSTGNIIYEGISSAYSTLKDAWDLGTKISNLS